MAVKRGPKFLHQRLAAQVKHRRLDLDMSQEELATKSGLHRTYIGGIERGERNVSLATLELVASGLGVDPAEILLDKNSRLVSVADRDDDFLGPTKTPVGWALAVNTAYDLLEGIARSGGTITYAKVNKAVREATGLKVPRGQITQLLEDLTIRSVARDDVMLSSLVVLEDGGEPAPGFLKLAQRLKGADPGVEPPKAIVKRLQKECWVAFGARISD